MRIERDGWVLVAIDYPAPPQGPGGGACHIFKSGKRRPSHSINGPTAGEALAAAITWTGAASTPAPPSPPPVEATPQRVPKRRWLRGTAASLNLTPLMLAPSAFRQDGATISEVERPARRLE